VRLTELFPNYLFTAVQSACPALNETTSRWRLFLPNAEARAHECASVAFVLLCGRIFAPTDGIATVL
jgi:hypothetical protein